jgi:hypothetical protein
MGRYDLRQLCVFVLACGAYFGGIPHMFLLGLGARDAEDFAAFAGEAVLTWVLLAAVYVYWRQLTPLVVHCLCVALSLPLVLGNSDWTAGADALHLDWAILGPCCWAGILVSFPAALALLAISAAYGRQIDPLRNRPLRGLTRRSSVG